MLSRRSLLMVPLGMLAGCGVVSKVAVTQTPSELVSACSLIDELDGQLIGLSDPPGAPWVSRVLKTYRESLVGPKPSPTGSASSASAQPRADYHPEKFAALAQRAASEWQQLAEQKTGFEALAWAAMSIGANSWTKALREQLPIDSGFIRHKPSAIASATAQGKVVIGAREIAYALTTVIPVAKIGSDDQQRLTKDWQEWVSYADLLTDQLRRAGKPVPQPAAVYDIRPVTSVAAAYQLLGQLETRFLATLGRWLAATDTVADRQPVFQKLSQVAVSARSHGGPTLVWPGWPTE